MFDPRLVRAINSRRCFVLVGSGLSCEIGYPSWDCLARDTYSQMVTMGVATDAPSYERYLESRKLPELFRHAEIDFGDRIKLLELVKRLLLPARRRKGVLYEVICKWPFACYLTTNFDNELSTHLEQLGEHFTVLRNRKKDFYPIRDGASHLIQKLHSDLDHPDEVVLTSSDYRRLYIDDDSRYFVDKLRQVFEMFDILIIGHSLTDPDIDYIVQLARKTASPHHPIYMIAADYSKADEREFLEKYNIVLMRYENRTGDHSELRRSVLAADRFIVPRIARGGSDFAAAKPSEEEAEAAAALYLFRRLQSTEGAESMSPLILAALADTKDEGMTREALLKTRLLKVLDDGNVAFHDAVDYCLKALIEQGLVTDVSAQYTITEQGYAKVQEFQTLRETEREQAFGQFALDLRSGYREITKEQVSQCRQFAEDALRTTFANRGLTITNQVYAHQSAGADELSDIFGYISRVAAQLPSEVQAAFVEAMHKFLVEPNAPQKKYLASVSQGFFLFHMLGRDPKCAQLRWNIFEKTLWLCDSSLLLPLIAVGCHNHDYALELFRLLGESHARVYTTPRLLQEAWRHFEWAVDFVAANRIDSAEFLRAALVKGSYKQNLFIDGYIRLSAEGHVGNFADYIEIVCPHGISRASFDQRVAAHVQLLTPLIISGFDQKDLGEIEAAKAAISTERSQTGTYRSELQVESEAEVWVLVKHIRSGKFSLPDAALIEHIYFVSQSKVLDKVFQPESTSTWTPEGLYRYTSALPGRQTDPDLIQQCMLHEYYYAGISFIDKERYLRFFGPSVDAAKASYAKEKTNYVSQVEKKYTQQLDEAFTRTPDLEKPFFVAQMGWRLAEASRQREEQASRRALEAEAKIRQLETEKDKGWKDREAKRQEQEAARLRNLSDPRHQRKRERQAKKRKRKQR